MTIRVVNEVGRRARTQIEASGLDVEVVDAEDPEPPPGLRAEVLFGGWSGEPRLRAWVEGCGIGWVQLAGTGADRVPAWLFDACTVTCARGASAVPISEFVLAALLAFEKRLPEIWVSEPPEHWNFDRLGTLQGRTLGLVGLGGIGQAVARRARPFGMEIVACRRSDTPSPVEGVEVVGSLTEVLARADHLVLALPLTPRTDRLLGGAAFAAMRPGVHLVNVARGRLVDEDALRAALDGGTVARATLDTVDPEPLPAGHWLYSHPGVRLSAHVSWVSPSGLETAVEVFVDNLGRRLRGAPLRDVVDPAEGY